MTTRWLSETLPTDSKPKPVNCQGSFVWARGFKFTSRRRMCSIYCCRIVVTLFFWNSTPLIEEAIHQSLVVRHRFNVSNVLNHWWLSLSSLLGFLLIFPYRYNSFYVSINIDLGVKSVLGISIKHPLPPRERGRRRSWRGSELECVLTQEKFYKVIFLSRRQYTSNWGSYILHDIVRVKKINIFNKVSRLVPSGHFPFKNGTGSWGR